MTTTQEIVVSIEERLSDTRQALAHARDVLKQVEQEEVALLRALKALAPESQLLEQEAKPKKPAPRPRTTKVSDALIERVREVLAAQAKPLTAAEIAEEIGKSKSSAAAALVVLRDRGDVRLAGVLPNVSGRGMPPATWALMNGSRS